MVDNQKIATDIGEDRKLLFNIDKEGILLDNLMFILCLFVYRSNDISNLKIINHFLIVRIEILLP